VLSDGPGSATLKIVASAAALPGRPAVMSWPSVDSRSVPFPRTGLGSGPCDRIGMPFFTHWIV
jgi:hypothetical protein